MNILLVNQMDGVGGAAGNTIALLNKIRDKGHNAYLIVGKKTKNMPFVKKIQHDIYRSIFAKNCIHAASYLKKYNGQIPGMQRLTELWLPRLASYKRFWAWWRGYEDFEFPGTKYIIEQSKMVPDVIHLNNLHGDYFDLRELSKLSNTVPTVITLRDAWLISGHCAHSLNCERWISGCGSCPSLNLPPQIRRDGTAFNWKRKRDIYKNCRLTLVCPSQWLARKVERSIIMPGTKCIKVINNGVDTSIFKPSDKSKKRDKLGWPQDAYIFIFAADSAKHNAWKDYSTMKEAIYHAETICSDKTIVFYAIGDKAPSEYYGRVRIEFIPYRDNIAECYQAADVYLHAAKADTFPTAVIESLACGTPVVATAVGGIPEQIQDEKTGYLVKPGDAVGMAENMMRLVSNPQLSNNMGIAARLDVQARFTINEMVDKYLELYSDTIKCHIKTNKNNMLD